MVLRMLPIKWPLAKVIKVHAGNVVYVKNPTGTCTQPVTKIAILASNLNIYLLLFICKTIRAWPAVMLSFISW